jgi:hypothetical protein
MRGEKTSSNEGTEPAAAIFGWTSKRNLLDNNSPTKRFRARVAHCHSFKKTQKKKKKKNKKCTAQGMGSQK